MTTRRTKHADQHQEAAPRTPAAADPVAAPVTRPRTAAEVRALQRAVGNEAVATILAEGAAAQGATAHDVLGEPGRPLAPPVRADMEARLGADFSTVRVHTGASAEQSAADLGAQAYTSGENVVLGPGGADRQTLAHELTHVVQQRSGPVSGTDNGAGLSVSDPSDTFERAAEESAKRALTGPASSGPPAAPHTAGGHPDGQPIQLDSLRTILKGLPTQLTHPEILAIERWLGREKIEVPASLPASGGRTTRQQTRQADRPRDPRLTIRTGGAVATISWIDLIKGDVISMPNGARNVDVYPHRGPALGAAVNALLDLMPRVANDSQKGPVATVLMNWLVRKRGGSGGKVSVETTPPDDNGAGARINIEGRPGWDEQAKQIVIGDNENRRHIIAWHTMRDGFQAILNAGLKDGDDVLARMRRLVEVLERVVAGPSPAEEPAEETPGDGGGAGPSGAVADSAQPASSADVAESSEATPVPETPSPTQSEAGVEDARALSRELNTVVTKVMGLLSNNPFNLWAGEGGANKSINRVRWQLSARLEKFTDDGQLLNDVRTRAQTAAGVQNEDAAVWTEVRDTLVGIPDDQARTVIQSIIDSFDIDIPVSGRRAPAQPTLGEPHPGQPYSTYNTAEDQRAAVSNILTADPLNGIQGLAQEVLAMSVDPLPDDFGDLVEKMEDWLERFLRPTTLRSAMTGGRRTVGRA